MGIASINGDAFFLDDQSDTNAYIRPIASISGGTSDAPGVVGIWID